MSGNGHSNRNASSIGWKVFVFLAVMTLIEYGVAIALSLNFFFLTQIAVLKAGFIIFYFMRISRAWQRPEDH
jgi:hypothetical protein